MRLKKRIWGGIATFAVIVSGALYAGSPVVGTIRATKGQRAEWASMAKITMEQAKEIALRETPGTIDDADLETEDGYLVYEIDIDGNDGDEYEFIIDAGSGAILRKKID